MTCMWVDLKSFIYVTIHLQRSPSWLNKPSILPQGQIETILWGLEHLMENSIFTPVSLPEKWKNWRHVW
ncbi:unnamed protein product [Brassica oleracea]